MTGMFIILRTSLRIQRGDIASPIVMAVLPLLLTPFLIPGARAQLQASGYPDATGAEQVVPGFAALFGFLAVQQIVTGFGREHQWGTWERLRAAPVSAPALVVGRSTACLLVQLAQLTFVILAGALLFAYRPNGSVPALMLALFSLSLMLVTFGVMLVAVFRSNEHALVAASVGGMVMAGIGGALAPVSSFPVWAQLVAHASPAYWALDALRSLSLDGASLFDVLPALGAMLGFTLVFAAIAAMRFKPAQHKTGLT
jgi:ABC-2 type transport system permease protein